jgi:hypothetical protein
VPNNASFALAHLGSHHCQYYGKAFYIKKDVAVQVPVDNRIMVDATFSWKMLPNESASNVNESGGWIMLGEAPSKPPPNQVKSTGMEPGEMNDADLIIYCPTVPGFSFNNKL